MGGVRLAGAARVGTIRAELPDLRVHQAADTARIHHVVVVVRAHAEHGDTGVVGVLHAGVLLVKIHEESLVLADLGVVRADDVLRRVAAAVPVGAEDIDEGSVVTGILVTVDEGGDGLLGRSHTAPRTAAVLLVGTEHRVDALAVVGIGLHVGVVPVHHPAGEVVHSAAAAVGEARTVVLLGILGMVGIEHDLRVAVVGAVADLVEVIHQAVGARVVDALQGQVIGLLEVPLGVVAVRIGAAALRIGRDLVRVLQPPGIGQVGLGQVQAGDVLRQGARQAGIHRKVVHRGLEVREDGLGVHLGNGVAHGLTDRLAVEGKFAGAQVERHAAEGLDQLEVVEGAEEAGLGDHRLVQAHGLGVLDDAAGGVDIREGVAPQVVAAGGTGV